MGCVLASSLASQTESVWLLGSFARDCEAIRGAHTGWDRECLRRQVQVASVLAFGCIAGDGTPPAYRKGVGGLSGPLGKSGLPGSIKLRMEGHEA